MKKLIRVLGWIGFFVSCVLVIGLALHSESSGPDFANWLSYALASLLITLFLFWAGECAERLP